MMTSLSFLGELFFLGRSVRNCRLEALRNELVKRENVSIMPFATLPFAVSL